MTTTVARSGIDDAVVEEFVAILGPEHVLTGLTDRYARTRVPAPFPVHWWRDYVPDLVVLPGSTEETAEVVRRANRYGIPVVPRDGGTGLTDGARPNRRGIVVDVKRMRQIEEIDLENGPCTVGVGINMLKLNEALARHDLIYPDDPASYPCSLVGGRIGTSGWSLVGSRFGHTRDLVLSFDIVLPIGQVITVGDGGRKTSKSSSGYHLKQLFMGHQGTLGIATRATLKLFPKPEAEFSPFWAFSDFDSAYQCIRALTRANVGTFAGAVLFDDEKVAYLRRDDEAYIPQPSDVRSLVCSVLYGNEDELRVGAKRLLRIARDHGARYLGDEISEGDWAARHDRYATALHGRTMSGQVVPMSDYLTEIDVGIWEQQLDDEMWEAFVEAKRDIAAAALAAGGSISACHGSCREGEVDLVPTELGGGYDVMLQVKRTLDPNNIMNPGKYGLDRAYETPGQHDPTGLNMVYRYRDNSTRPEATQITDVAIRRYEDVYEVDPKLMVEHVTQQTFPNWDTLRIVQSRHDHLQWMHDHWAHRVVSGEELLREIQAEES